MVFNDITRKQAFLTHLSVSMLIFFILSYLIIFQWYPSYYLFIDGGDRGLATIFFVDVILGPGLTLLVFKQGKKNLKFDLAVILAFQVIALSWGIKSVYTARPALTVFYDGKFSCIANDDVPKNVLDGLNNNQFAEPTLAFLQRPDTFKTYMSFVSKPYKSGSAEIYYYQDQFATLNENSIERIKTYTLNVEAEISGLENKDEMLKLRKTWDKYISNNPRMDDAKYFPLDCRYKKVVAVFDMKQREIIDYVDMPLMFARAKSNIELHISEEEKKEYDIKGNKQTEKN